MQTFSPLSTMFSNVFFPRGVTCKSELCSKLLSDSFEFYPFLKQALVFTCRQYKSLENTVGKGEIARNEQFPLFPVFYKRLENFMPILSNLELSPANSFSSEVSKFCCFEKGLNEA